MARSQKSLESLVPLLDDVARLCGPGPDQLGLLDRAHQIERVLTGLGWNTSDPREVTRRPAEASTSLSILLSIAGTRSVQIIVCDTHAAENVEDLEPDVGWVAVTNGVGWSVRRGSDTTFVESFSLANRNAGERLQELLSKRSHGFGLVSRHDLRRRLSVLVDAEIAKAIDRSPDLEASLLEQLPRLANGGMALGELLGELLPPVDADPVRRMPPQGRFVPTSPESVRWLAANCPGGDVVWPEEATHLLRRKGCASFIRFSPDLGTVHLLPRSVMLRATRASFPAFHQRLRADALACGFIVPDGDFLRVATAFPVDTPSTAATLVSGTVENGLTAWRDREGRPIPRETSRVRRRSMRGDAG